jgi:DNA-binding CsgD family transcriptional regulator
MPDRVIGRDHELAVAATFLDGVADHAGAGLLIDGDAGIGKTAFVRAVIAAAERRGYRVLRCAGEQAETRLSFAGVADLVGDVIDEVPLGLPVVQQEALDVAILRTKSGSGKDPDPRAVGMALSTMLTELAESRPTLAVVDDAGWLDPATANALGFAARRVDGQRIGFVTTVRLPADNVDPLGLRRAFGDDNSTTVSLGPLDGDALVVLIERHFGTRFAQPLLRRIASTAGGNPLFALEIARALGPDASIEAGMPLPVPDNLRELVARRVAALPDAARTALLAASALTDPSASIVEAVSSEEGLAAAEMAGLLRVERGHVRFGHPLYASAVYAGAASAHRRSLHRRLATLVADAEECVRHLALGASGPDAAVAKALEGAAVAARSRGAWETAGELLELAQSLTPADERHAAWRRSVSAAEHHIHAGDRRRARAILEDVLAAEPDRPNHSHALRLLGEIEYNEESLAAARSVLQTALHDADDAASRALVHLDLAYAWAASDIEAAAEHAAAALAQAEQSDDHGLLAECLAVQVIVAFMGGHGADWAQLKRALELEDNNRIVPFYLRPQCVAFTICIPCCPFCGQWSFDQMLATTAERGDESDLAYVHSWTTFLLARAGRLDEARHHLAEAQRQAAFAGRVNRVWVLAHATFLKALSGDAEGARADAAEAAALAAETQFVLPLGWSMAALAMLGHSLGDPAAAWAAVEGAVEMVESGGLGEPGGAMFVPEGIEALVELGELDRADRLLTLWQERAGALDRSWALASAGRCRAVLCAARGDNDGAVDAIEDALIAHKRHDMPIELGRTLLAQGKIRRRRRERRTSGESMQTALELFEHAGAPLWAQRARAELERLGRRRPANELTTTEARVAALVAEGCSNKQVARVLFISPKTVETNLSRVYRKFGVANRAALGAEMARRTAG